MCTSVSLLVGAQLPGADDQPCLLPWLLTSCRTGLPPTSQPVYQCTKWKRTGVAGHAETLRCERSIRSSDFRIHIYVQFYQYLPKRGLSSVRGSPPPRLTSLPLLPPLPCGLGSVAQPSRLHFYSLPPTTGLCSPLRCPGVSVHTKGTGRGPVAALASVQPFSSRPHGAVCTVSARLSSSAHPAAICASLILPRSQAPGLPGARPPMAAPPPGPPLPGPSAASAQANTASDSRPSPLSPGDSSLTSSIPVSLLFSPA